MKGSRGEGERAGRKPGKRDENFKTNLNSAALAAAARIRRGIVLSPRRHSHESKGLRPAPSAFW